MAGGFSLLLLCFLALPQNLWVEVQQILLRLEKEIPSFPQAFSGNPVNKQVHQ